MKERHSKFYFEIEKIKTMQDDLKRGKIESEEFLLSKEEEKEIIQKLKQLLLKNKSQK
jgi:hypothetical protein